jgi:hypothetical protein
MTQSIADIPKRRGRPSTGGRGEGVMVRLQPEGLGAVDAWRRAQDDKPSRPEAIRRLVAIAVKDARSEEPQPMSDRECELQNLGQL